MMIGWANYFCLGPVSKAYYTFNGTPLGLSGLPYSGAQPRCLVLVEGK